MFKIYFAKVYLWNEINKVSLCDLIFKNFEIEQFKIKTLYFWSFL